MTVAQMYLNAVQKRFRSVKELGDKTLDQLEEAQLHWTYNEDSNSIAVIVKHISGNMISRWTDFLTTDGEKVTRNRDDEFTDSLQTKEDIMTVWEEGWQVFLEALQRLTEADLQGFVTIRGEQQSVIDAIERQMSHYSQHVGQIVYIAKQLKGSKWQTLSIPKGQSQAFTESMVKKHQ
ncbi:DUF1572 family protein [Lysinibacillus xylanilyticus]|uniref:DUF1572 domain-containing protein n=1 Tax=Lysinibacillus xylanilyticus TaxID=582475 RepID=A0A2M9Q2E0_9BACI|nr:DUF1572 family protein [Lysinibacillus xylanilyticus]PJO42247.1 hypothetical protein CWD94_18355 [Lysinibacillus xylanilyticus]